jgi:hypothetical protein
MLKMIRKAASLWPGIAAIVFLIAAVQSILPFSAVPYL